METASVILKRGEETRILNGHPWVYDNEIFKYDGPSESGTVADVYTDRKKFIGRGLVSGQSKIRIRLVSGQKEGIDRGFFKRQTDRALRLRSLNYNFQTDSFRIIFAEADFLPGFTADCFTSENGEKVLVYQSLFAGIEPYKDHIIDALDRELNFSAVVERSDAAVRKLEGLPETKNLVRGKIPVPLIIKENGIRLAVDVLEGQKTGYFLDQKENRDSLAPYCRDARVLDAFSHTGGFGLNAARAGAREVLAVDISGTAVRNIEENIRLNEFESVMRGEDANVFDFLNRAAGHDPYDLIILDPPAFTKNRASQISAVRGYKEINLKAMKILRNEGILVTCSCSHYLYEPEFDKLLNEAAKDARVSLQILESRGASKDHPVLSGYDESRYLKCRICRICRM